MNKLPLRWDPKTHGLLNPATCVNLGLVPGVVREQATTLLDVLGDDVKWVVQPLAHTLAAPAFGIVNFAIPLNSAVGRPSGFSPTGWLSGLEVLSKKYPEIPAVLWDTFAIMGLRPNADQEEAIPNLGDLLHHPWSVSDAALHGAAKATALWADICHTLERHSGRYPEHGCGCNHLLRELSSGASFPAMPEDRMPHVTREWWEHFLSEVALIHIQGFPFSLNANRKKYEHSLMAA